MRFIGQFIQSLVARFRNDVYLEDVSTGTIASGGNLGLDANNKIVKADTNAGELSITNASDNRIVTSTGGTGLNAESTLTYTSETLSISSTSSTKPIVSLLNTNADENAPVVNFLKIGSSAADNDTIGSINFTSTNDAVEGATFADFVTTISDASDGDESGRISMRVIADGNLRNFIDGVGSSLDTVDVTIGYGTDSQTVIAGDFSAKGGLLTYANEDLSLNSSTSARPNLFLGNTNTDAEAPTVTFVKNQTGADNDDIGIIRFKADDDGDNVTTFAEILGEIETAADGSEGGNLILKVASHDGEMQEGIKISDGSVEDEIDVTIGSGSASLTTITGTLTMGSTAAMTNAGLVSVAGQTNITSLGTLTNLQTDFINLNASTLTITDSTNTSDLFSIATTTNGVTTISTTDDSHATLADLTLSVQGALSMSSTTQKINKIYDFNATTFENLYPDDEGSGTILKYSPGADESPNGSELFYLELDGTWNNTRANAASNGGYQLLGVGLGASARTTGLLLEGFVRIASTEILNVPGSGAVDGLPVYVSITQGHFDFTPPSASGSFVRVVGHAIDDDGGDVLIYFKPSSVWVEIA
jgi:hypothetical protein